MEPTSSIVPSGRVLDVGSSARTLTILGRVKIWTGTEWIPCTVKVWDGTSWSDADLKFYDGVSWQ